MLARCFTNPMRCNRYLQVRVLCQINGATITFKVVAVMALYTALSTSHCYGSVDNDTFFTQCG